MAGDCSSNGGGDPGDGSQGWGGSGTPDTPGAPRAGADADYLPDPARSPHQVWARDTYPFTVARHHTRGYGWRPDHPDHRDRYHRPSGKRAANAVDLSGGCPPVYNQGPLASCSANAVAAALAFARRAAKRTPDETPSRLFIYFGQRVIQGSVEFNSGGSLRNAIKVIAADGVCFEQGANAWPYIPSRAGTPPPNSCFRAAAGGQVDYHRLRQTPNVTDFEDCLSSGHPFVFGFVTFEALDSDAVAETGLLPMPTKGKDRPTGGHAAMAVGYDHRKKLFKVRNSWGANWGDGGCFYMPYAYLADPDYASDFWTLRL